MEQNLTCNQCDAIAHELSDAYTNAWDSAGERTREAWAEFYKLIISASEQANHPEKLDPPRAHLKHSLRINRAFENKFYHEAKTRHKIPWSFPAWMRSRSI
jgi:hypothetical protein